MEGYFSYLKDSRSMNYQLDGGGGGFMVVVMVWWS